LCGALPFQKKLFTPEFLLVEGPHLLVSSNLAISTVNIINVALRRSRKPEEIRPMPGIFFLPQWTVTKPARI
ncbi:MAG: hypothetical protein PVG76_05785, partial [Chromatiales bacterium]